MPNPASIEERLVELESRHMHQEHLIDELNGVLIDQRRIIERLERELAVLQEQMRAGPTADGGHDEKPPHY